MSRIHVAQDNCQTTPKASAYSRSQKLAPTGSDSLLSNVAGNNSLDNLAEATDILKD